MRGFWLGIILGFAAASALMGMVPPAVKPITRQGIYEATSAAIRLEVRNALDSYFAVPSKGEPYAHP